MKNTTPERGPGPPREMDGNFTLLTDDDLHWFNEGTHCRIYQKMGAHLVEQNGVPGVCFSVWAPNAAQVFVMGDFNGWNKTRHPLAAHRPVRRLERVHSQAGPGRHLQVSHRLAARRLRGGQGRSVRRPPRDRARGPHRSSGTWTTPGVTPNG